MAPTVPAWDALADWTTMNRAMTAEAPMHTASGIGLWRHLGIGPGRSVASQPPATRDGLARAAAFGRRTLAEPDPRHRRGTIDGWTPVAPAFDPSTRYVGAWLYLAIPGSVVGFTAYLLLVGRLGPERAAYCTVLFPLVALAISSVVEDYRWTPPALLGLALVMTGNVLVFRKPKGGGAGQGTGVARASAPGR